MPGLSFLPEPSPYTKKATPFPLWVKCILQHILSEHSIDVSNLVNNLLICKTETENDTITEVKTLTENDKINEIVRLVGGSVDSEFAVKHAVDMIQTAKNYKKTI